MPELKPSVGRYEILGELGRGGMATVYLSRQTDLDRLAALKELGALRSSDPSFAGRFLREAQLAGSLSDPNVVVVYDYFEYGGAPYIAMEYLEHGSLRPYVGRMSLAEIGGVLEAVLAGLAAAEKRQIVHRDLKPENLLITANGRVKISDFGIAKATNELRPGQALTSTGMAVGTPNYMAPEQAIAQGVGPWTDLYSTGIMAFEFFVGHPPFGDSDNVLGVLLRQVNEEIPAVNELDPSVDARLSDWIGRMVAKEPAERPESAAAAWDELEDTLIALLGPRWQREARLAPLGEADPGVLPIRPIRSTFAAPPTEPVDSPAPAITVPPRAVTEVTRRTPRRRRRVGANTARLVLGGVAVVAAAAALLGRTGGSHSPAPAAAPDTPRATASPTTSNGREATGTTSRGQVTTVGPSTAAPPPAGAPVDQQQNPPSRADTDRVALASEAKTSLGRARQYDNSAAQIEGLRAARTAGSPTARLAVALRRTAAAYRAGAAAAVAGNVAGYAAALREATAGKQAVNTALADMRADAGAPTSGSNSTDESQQAPPVEETPCSGDSVSDDPSDESC